MSGISKKIEVASNIAIIVLVIMVGVVITKNYFPRAAAGNTAGTNSNRGIAANTDLVGKKISLPDTDLAENGRNLVLVIHSKCHYCTDSAPFYKQLVNRQNTQSPLQLIAISSEPIEASKAYLDSLGVSVNKVKQADLRSLGITGTPTLLQVDGSGIVTNAWLGKLDSAREAEVLAHIQ